MSAVTWIVITANDLNGYLVAAQVAALRTAATAVGQTDRFAEVMPDVVKRIRKKIESCTRNQLSATPNSVPPELKTAACILTIQAMQAGIPGLKLTDEQRTMIETAESDLRDIAACKMVVSQPTDPLVPSEAQTSGTIQMVNKPTRHATRTKLAGL
jgi:hypothetical protein